MVYHVNVHVQSLRFFVLFLRDVKMDISNTYMYRFVCFVGCLLLNI